MHKKTKLTTEYPPLDIYKECVKRFGANFETGTVFTYGDKIHCKAEDMSDDLYMHELTHLAQQREVGADVWWEKYLTDDTFRLEQEKEAYLNQWAHAMNTCNSAYRKRLKKHMIDSFSGKLYGNIISKEEAEKLFV